VTLEEHFGGRRAIVTGGASGIGKALAAALVARGATVVLADIDGDGAHRVAEELGGSARAVELDVTDAAAVKALVEDAAGSEGLDFLFNNAGIGGGGPVEKLGLEVWDRLIDVDLRSVIYGVAAAYPLMVRRGEGHIVNTASLAGLVPSPYLTPYAAAKSAVVGLSTSLRVEAAANGVRVSALCPGPVETPLLSRPDPKTAGGPAPSVNARKLLTNQLGEPYPPEDLAADVLAGVVENRALIVAPQSARDAWAYFSAHPEEMLTSMGERALAGRRRREGRATEN